MRRSGKQTLLDERGVLRLLQTEIAKAGGQSTWAKRNGSIDRTSIPSRMGAARFSPWFSPRSDSSSCSRARGCKSGVPAMPPSTDASSDDAARRRGGCRRRRRVGIYRWKAAFHHFVLPSAANWLT